MGKPEHGTGKMCIRDRSLPGISSGTELLSGLYVHGGRNDENLFLLDGTPVYQINHPVSYTHLDVYKRQGCCPMSARRDYND